MSIAFVGPELRASPPKHHNFRVTGFVVNQRGTPDYDEIETDIKFVLGTDGNGNRYIQTSSGSVYRLMRR